MFQYDHPMWCCFNFNSSLRQTQFAQCIRRLQRSARRSLSPRGRVGMRNNISALLMEVLSIMFSKVEAGWKRKARTFLTEVCNHVWVVIGTKCFRIQTCQSPSRFSGSWSCLWSSKKTSEGGVFQRTCLVLPKHSGRKMPFLWRGVFFSPLTGKKLNFLMVEWAIFNFQCDSFPKILPVEMRQMQRPCCVQPG